MAGKTGGGDAGREVSAAAGIHPGRTGADSFGEWLRGLPLREGRGVVNLCTGRRKPNQGVHAAVIDIDTGKRTATVADAGHRLRAEYLFGTGCEEEIGFHFTSGDLATWRDYSAGLGRPVVTGNEVAACASGARSRTPPYHSFRRYLDLVFTYAGTASLRRELTALTDASRIIPGDVFVQPWGHAALVLDVAEDETGRRVFLLAQSYMPAQEYPRPQKPGGQRGAWYDAVPGRPLEPRSGRLGILTSAGSRRPHAASKPTSPSWPRGPAPRTARCPRSIFPPVLVIIVRPNHSER